MGHPRLRLLYLTPETLFSPKYKSDIDVCARQGQLNRLVIDEAHVIEVSHLPMLRRLRSLIAAQEWGMTFRPMYRKLGAFRDVYPGIPVTVRQRLAGSMLVILTRAGSDCVCDGRGARRHQNDPSNSAIATRPSCRALQP